MKIPASATRMELMKLKRRLIMAQRGHKLLKDKLEGLSQEFLKLIKEQKILREKLENSLSRIFSQMVMLYGVLGPKILSEALIPSVETSFKLKKRNVMGVSLPVLEIISGAELHRDEFPLVSLELEQIISDLNTLMPELIRLAEIEKGIELLGLAIKKTRRRVNALEYIFIPDLEQTVKFISQKLSEMGRSALTSLIKIKASLF